MMEREMKVGLIISKESSHLVSHSEVFEWGDYFCIRMEYCCGGDLQDQFDKERIFTEEVYYLILYEIIEIILYSGNYSIYI
jgi:serine/threonine protein kinase